MTSGGSLVAVTDELSPKSVGEGALAAPRPVLLPSPSKRGNSAMTRRLEEDEIPPMFQAALCPFHVSHFALHLASHLAHVLVTTLNHSSPPALQHRLYLYLFPAKAVFIIGNQLQRYTVAEQ